MQKRQCGECKACCEGWLSGQVNNHLFYPGCQCHYLGETGCTIYKDRPQYPCQDYNCEWLINETVPEWLKPSESKVILSTREIDGMRYLEVVEAGSKMTAEVMSWILMEFAKGTITNLVYEIDGTTSIIGTHDFYEAYSKACQTGNLPV